MDIYKIQKELNRQNLLLHGQSMHDYLEDKRAIRTREIEFEYKVMEDAKRRIEKLEEILG